MVLNLLCSTVKERLRWEARTREQRRPDQKAAAISKQKYLEVTESSFADTLEGCTVLMGR